MPSPNVLARLATLALLAALFAIPSGSAQSGPLGLAYQFTHSDNSDLTISPDGKQVVVLSVIAGREQLVRMNVDRSSPVQLTTDAADHEDPAWSPDGKKIAFVLIRDGREQIQLMNPDGTGVEPLTPADRKTIHPSWSPDSQSVLYCTDDDLHPPAKNDAEIYSINLASKKTTRLISGGVNTYPALSPDGEKDRVSSNGGDNKLRNLRRQ